MLFQDQAGRWNVVPGLTAAQPAAVREYEAAIGELRRLNAEVLAAAGQLKPVTIEALLARSDLEAGIEALLRGWPGTGSGSRPATERPWGVKELMITALPPLAVRMSVRRQGSCFQGPARESYSQVIHRRIAGSGLSGIDVYVRARPGSAIRSPVPSPAPGAGYRSPVLPPWAGLPDEVGPEYGRKGP